MMASAPSSAEETEAILFCVNELIGLKRRFGLRVFPWQLELGRRFDTASLSMSPRGHGSSGIGSEEAQLETPVLIGTRDAAELLGLSTRQIRRIAANLGGETIGGRMVFRLSVVTKYAEDQPNAQPR